VGKRSEKPDHNRLKELNTLFKMFDIEAVCYYDQGKPNVRYGPTTWRPWPFRIDCMAGKGNPYVDGRRICWNGEWEDEMRTQWMFSTLSGLEAKVHEMISLRQAKEHA
jgi:hypothetical protein